MCCKWDKRNKYQNDMQNMHGLNHLQLNDSDLMADAYPF
jgi:hypothetical protein